jgi:hypothetical protein
MAGMVDLPETSGAIPLASGFAPRIMRFNTIFTNPDYISRYSLQLSEVLSRASFVGDELLHHLARLSAAHGSSESIQCYLFWNMQAVPDMVKGECAARALSHLSTR